MNIPIIAFIIGFLLLVLSVSVKTEENPNRFLVMFIIGAACILLACFLGVASAVLRLGQARYYAERERTYNALMYQIEQKETAIDILKDSELLGDVAKFNEGVENTHRSYKNPWTGFLSPYSYDYYIPIDLAAIAETKIEEVT